MELARRLGERGHEARIVELGAPLFDARQDGNEPRVPVVRLNLSKPVDRVGLLEWYLAFRALDCDALIFEKGAVRMGTIALDVAARVSTARYVTVEHVDPPPRPALRTGRHLGGWVPGLGLWWYRLVGGTYLRSVAPSNVVTVSKCGLERLRAYGFPSRKLVAVLSGVDPSRFSPAPELRDTIRRAWGIPAGAFVFGTVGRLAAWHKGQDIALELLARLRAARPGSPFAYVLVGEGDDRASLARQAESLGLGEHVIFAGQSARPWEAYNAIDVLLMPSRFEGTPFALLEAMACQRPAVAMGVGGIPEVIGRPELGWLVSPGDREGFLDAMAAALDMSASDRQAMGEQARRHVAEHFSADRQYARLVALIEHA